MEIEGYENYTIDENGLVMNIKFNRIMKPYIDHKGYLRLGIRRNNKEKKFFIHRLLAITFIPNPNNYLEIDHIDRIPLNNNLSNLRWADRSIQNNNKNAYGKIKHKYISYIYDGKNKSYRISKKGYFNKQLSCLKWSLQQAIELRTQLLIEHDLDPIAPTD